MTGIPFRRKLRRWARRVALLLGALWFLSITVLASFAAADGFSGRWAADPIVSWMDLKDSHGVPVYAYQISGTDSITDPIDRLWVASADFAFATYREVAAYGVWFLDWVTGFTWYDLLNGPANSVGAKFSMILGQMSIAPAFMAVAGVAALLAMGSGKHGSAIYELVATWTIAALATGVLANPLGAIGGQDGWIMDTRNAALELAGSLITPLEGDYVLDTRTGAAVDKPEVNVSSDTEQLQKQLTTTLVDVFIRQPAQLINYGKVLDRGGCEGVYTDVTKDGPYSEPEIPKDKVAACDEQAGNFADNPGPHQALAAFVLIPASLVILAMAILIGGAIITSVGMVLYLSVKLLWSTLQALLPGRARAGLFLALSEILTCLVLLFFSVFILAVYEYIVAGIFKDADSTALPKTFIIADVVLVVLLVIYTRQRKRIKESAQSLADLMAKRPGGQIPVRGGGQWSPGQKILGAVGTAAMVARRRRRPVPSTPTTSFHAQQFNFYGTGQQEEEDAPDTTTTVTQMHPTAPRKGNTAARLAAITGQAATQAAMSHLTGGVSTVMLAARRAQQLKLAAGRAAETRAALQGRLQPAELPGAPQRRALPPGPSASAPSNSASTSEPRNPRGPRPSSGGGLFGWLRNRQEAPANGTEGYSRVNTRSGPVLVQRESPAPQTRAPHPSGTFWSRLRRR